VPKGVVVGVPKPTTLSTLWSVVTNPPPPPQTYNNAKASFKDETFAHNCVQFCPVNNTNAELLVRT
jgi:hypothetical protein